MSFEFPSLLVSILCLPLLTACVLLLLPSQSTSLMKGLSLTSCSLNFLFSLILWLLFDESTASFQFFERFAWLPFANLQLVLGVDGISLYFLVLTNFLVPACLLVNWKNEKMVRAYLISFLCLQSAMLAVFCILDLLLFYVFFESVLIPMFFIIGIWGSRERKIRAAYQFFLYTLFGSVLMLLAILLIYFQAGTTDYQILITTSFSEKRQLLLWLAFFASFAVKVPMVPVHIWLPEAHVEAPTGGSVILAGILLKLGTYGFIRFSIPMFPHATLFFTPLIYSMSVIAILYASLTTLRQIDLKKIIAYSSVAHMNYVTLGIFSLNLQGIEGSLLLMLSHGLVSSALFLCVGCLYERSHTRLVKYYGGLVQSIPFFALLFLFFTLGNISLPGTSSFVGEFLILCGVFQTNPFVGSLAASGMIFGTAYSMWLYNRLCFGNVKTPLWNQFADLNRRELALFFPFVFGVLWMGLYPEVFLSGIHMSVSSLLS